jgi:hypothetical protein
MRNPTSKEVIHTALVLEVREGFLRLYATLDAFGIMAFVDCKY